MPLCMNPCLLNFPYSSIAIYHCQFLFCIFLYLCGFMCILCHITHYVDVFRKFIYTMKKQKDSITKEQVRLIKLTQ